MPLLDSLMGLLGKALPVSEGAAMDRFTQTPILREPHYNPNLYAGFDPKSTPLQAMLQQSGAGRMDSLFSPATGRTGFNMTTPGIIEVQDPRQENLRHEIVHAATVPELEPSSRTYKLAQSALPKQIQDEVPTIWSKFVGTPGFDPVHEGVARFLTSEDYKDPKWNQQKLKLLNTFSTPTRGKLTRMLGDFSAK